MDRFIEGVCVAFESAHAAQQAARVRQRRKQDAVGVIFRDGHMPTTLRPSVNADGAMVGTGRIM